MDDLVVSELRRRLGKDKVFTEDFVRFAYSRDWSPRPAGDYSMPGVVVRPTSTDEVAEVVRVAYESGIPVVPFAGGTGMGGGAVPVEDCILIDTRGLNRILEIDKESMVVVTQAGVTVSALNEELAKHGLWWPHDPESKPVSTVGAAISCDNDGTFGIKYGKLADYLLDVVVVTGKGEVVRLGHRKALCSSTGYKLHWLMVGAEGTLGIVTEATLRV
ncbi:MAG: FAD-binding oxidoreductase, partial [Candidatus Freyarchaeota archaeon]|nr:FAD-binding oxidoreductase [Candidatus Jordarchaeia archaeon]